MSRAFSRRFFAFRFSLTAAALFTGGAAVHAQTARTIPIAPVQKIVGAAKAKRASENYFGVYLKNTKVGAFYFSRNDHAFVPQTNRPAVRTDAKTTIDLRILGAPANQVVDSIAWTEPLTGKPLREETLTRTGGRTSKTTAIYTNKSVSYVVDVQGEKKTGTLTLAPGEVFLADPQNGGAAFTPVVGATIKGKVFAGDLLRLVDSEAVVAGEETITVNNQAVRAYKILDKNPVGPSTLYVNQTGDLLRVDTLLGMQMRREPKAVALAPASDRAAKLDLAALVSIRPTGVGLNNPRALRTATYQLSGATRPLPPADSVQTATASLAAPSAAPQTLTVTVTVQTVPETTAPLFSSAAPTPENLRPFLQSSLYVPANDSEFGPLARRIVGGETQTGKAAQKIAAYVHQTITPDPSIPALRTARDILHEPRGVCRDYTTLFTTLARSVGLPTKQCTGVVYAGGAFLYHAWPEVWVGKNAQTGADNWVALEPTWGQPWADATHIKLAEGEITDVANVAADIGNYQIAVVETSDKPVKETP